MKTVAAFLQIAGIQPLADLIFSTILFKVLYRSELFVRSTHHQINMSGDISKFKRARARLRGTAAAEIPVPFDVSCECGGRVTGIRTSSWQQTSCPSCHTSCFLLPANVYPSTDSVESHVIGGTFGHRLRVVAGEVLVPQKRRLRSQGDVLSKNRSRTENDSAAGNEPASTQPRRWRSPRRVLSGFHPVRFVRRAFSPFRLLLAGIIMIVSTTGYWVYQSRQYEAARTTWHKETDAIPSLVEQYQIEELEQALGRAAKAGRLLGLSGQKWRYVLNLLDETRAVRSIYRTTVPELISEVREQIETGSQLPDSLRLELKRVSFVVDGYIDPVDSRSGSYLLDIPAGSAGHAVSVQMRLPQLGDYLNQNETHRFVFAFRLSDIELNGNSARQTWTLTVAPESFVLLTSVKYCEQLGFPVSDDPSLTDILLSQRTFIEESESWAERRKQHLRQHIARRSSHH
ncbi:MAG: hypothetical protein MK110_14950 [Fuerstiella sp.]|nr:hypothetical protein [Fuerstiella sp.]